MLTADRLNEIELSVAKADAVAESWGRAKHLLNDQQLNHIGDVRALCSMARELLIEVRRQRAALDAMERA